MSAQPEQANSPTKLDLGQGRSTPSARGGWNFLKRGIALAVSAALAAVILTTALPPLVADQTDRAVVNAPVTLLTAPIAGEIRSLAVEPGEILAPHAPVAELINSRVDRTTLIALESKEADSEGELEAISAKQDSDARYLNALTAEIEQQKATVEARYGQQLVDLQAQVGSAGAALEEKRQVLGHQTDMVKRDVAAPEMAKSATQQLSAAAFQKESVQSKLAQKQAQLDSARQGIFVGDDVHDLAAMIQKKRDMALDLQRLEIERAQVTGALQDQIRLRDAERDRFAMLEHATISAPEQGEVLNIGAAVGRHVNAGDTLARLVDCRTSFVVAIFSYRQGADLSVGTRVSIGAGSAGAQQGTVTDVLPKTSDKVDETYAVPFPQTERRELYVLVRPDEPLRTAASDRGRDQCDIGQWVTVTRANGWVPSTSVLWRDAGRLVSAAVASAIPRSWAKTLGSDKDAASASPFGAIPQSTSPGGTGRS
jgi:multidrug efflux pump subunit AcrA (membrane-fusion protein)